MKRVVILSTKAPYGSSINAEGFRAGLGLAFSEFIVDIVLVKDGVYALMKEQSPQDLNMKSLAEVYQNIAQFNINLFFDMESLRRRGLNGQDLVAAQPLAADELKAKLQTADAVLTF
ncbi:DsrE family protein [candidate division WOR-3 bacterium]|nr:DsrE family protein [candidate division WOR-3 bacterium]